MKCGGLCLWSPPLSVVRQAYTDPFLYGRQGKAELNALPFRLSFVDTPPNLPFYTNRLDGCYSARKAPHGGSKDSQFIHALYSMTQQ